MLHILSQYIWPDEAPTSVYATQLAAFMDKRGLKANLVGGRSRYREAGYLSELGFDVIHLEHFLGQRGSKVKAGLEYLSLALAFRKYIKHNVSHGDRVIVTSAPPTSVLLIDLIHRKKAKGVFWLQEYYPELMKVFPWYRPCFLPARCVYDRYLSKWDRVIKIGSNQAYHGKNVQVIRNWPTCDIPQNVDPEPKTVLYSGNIGRAHCRKSLFEKTDELHQQGYDIRFYADGVGAKEFPSYIKCYALLKDTRQLGLHYARHEIHLIAAHPNHTRGIFPSKIWNSIASGRKIIATGFRGEMEIELQNALKSNYSNHLNEWEELIAGI